MSGKFYALWLFLACLAALLVGYALGGRVIPSKPLESVSLPQEVRYYGTVEAQGAKINDRGVK